MLSDGDLNALAGKMCLLLVVRKIKKKKKRVREACWAFVDRVREIGWEEGTFHGEVCIIWLTG